MIQQAEEYFSSRADRYPFKAESGALNPRLVDENIYGHFITIARGNKRIWGFANEAGRDAFVKDWHGVAQ